MSTLDLTNLLQVAVIVGVAVLIAVAALIGSLAGGAWNQALREEIRWAAAITESVVYLYGSEAPLGFRLAAMDETAARLSAPGVTSSEPAEVEAGTLERAAFELRRPYEDGDHLVAGDRYRTPDGYDVTRRLGDLEQAVGVSAGWEETTRLADRYRAWAVGLGLGAALLVVAYPFAHLRIRAERRRRQEPGDREVGMIPRPSSHGFGGALGWVVFAAWFMVAVLPGVQIRSTMSEQREQALAAATAARLSLMIAVSNARSSFETTSLREAEITAATGLARDYELVGREKVSAELLPLARAEQDVRPRLVEVARFMARPPTAADGLGSELSRAVTSSRDDWIATLASQQRHAAEASRNGALASRFQVATLLAALAVAMGTLAAANERRRRLLTGAAGGMLMLALAYGVAAVMA